MRLILAAFALVLFVIYVWLLLHALLRPANAPADRAKLAMLVGEAVMVTALARVAVPWSEITGWLWVVGAGAVGAGTALAVARWRALPWLAAASPWRRRLRGTVAAAYVAVLAAITGGIMVTFI